MAFLAALAIAGLMLWLGIYLRDRRLDYYAKLSEIVSAVLAVGAVVAAAAGRIARWVPAPKLKDEQVQSDLADLAAALRIQARSEGVLSGPYVYDRLPMPVRWRPTGDLSSIPRPRMSDPAHAEEAETLAGTFDEVLPYFRTLPDSRLLVLGDAGGGKTVLVTELARRLLAARAADDPVPVVIPVAAWNPSQVSLFDWVSQQLVRINADLARQVSDGRRYITRAQALVDRMKVVPILDGLDEVAEDESASATVAINQYGWTQPLVVTCRTREYQQTIAAKDGTPIARVATVTLQPLEVADIKGYLGLDADGHWRPIYERLDAEPDGPIATALANPLMLWLTWAVYSGDGRHPAELTDRRRFGSIDAIDHHLLAEFVPAVYPGSTKRPRMPVLRRLLALRRPPQRWLGFLAADATSRYRQTRFKRRTRTRRPIDMFETRDDQNVAWWRFAAAFGLRIVSVALRGGILGALLWKLVSFELHRGGYVRHGSFAGPIHFQALFLSGPLGRSIWPTVKKVVDAVPTLTRRHAFSDINAFVRLIFQHHSSAAIFSTLVGALLVAGIRASQDPARPRHLHLGVRHVAQFIPEVLFSVISLALVIWWVLAHWHRTDLTSSIFTARSTWYAVVAVGLMMSLPGFPRRLVVPTDVVGAVGPLESLRMDRWADVVVTTTRRAIVFGIFVLLSGTQLALTYLVFAVVSTFMALVLGGRGASASRSYTDARIWLAITRRLPWQPMNFLTDARRRGVFQEIGAIFRFRHERVQRELRDWYKHYRPGIREWSAAYRRLADELSGDHAATLAGARQRVASCRWLAEQDFAEFGQDLARALSIKASLLRAQGYRDEELNALAELVDTRRTMADADPVARSALARSLFYFTRRLDAGGRYDQTLGVMTEAIEILCQLDAVKREAYLPEFESTLSWLARPGGPADRDAAAARTIDAVLKKYSAQVRDDIYDDPDARAAALVRLGHLLRRHSPLPEFQHDVEEVLTEAAQIYAANALAEPAAAWPVRAKKLSGLAAQLAGPEHAKAAMAGSVVIYRELTRRHPDTYQRLLIDALCRLATLNSGSGREQELRAIREAVCEYRTLARSPAMPGAIDAPVLLAGLSELVLRLWRLGEQGEAVKAAVLGSELTAALPGEARAGQSTDQQRLIWDGLTEPPLAPRIRASRLISAYPSRLTKLAERHDTEAFRLLLAGRPDESRLHASTAAAYCRQLVAVYRRFADTRPADELSDLADSLDLLATQLRKTGSTADADADAAAAEALHIRRRLGMAVAEP